LLLLIDPAFQKRNILVMRSLKTLLVSWLLVAFVFLGYCSASFYNNDPNVLEITKYSSFEKKVLQGDGIWMVQFFSPSCPHCKQIALQYSQVAEISKGIINIAVVDMSTTAGQRIGATYKVDSYPSVYMYGEDKANPKLYNGQRDAQNLLQAIMDVTMDTLRVRASGGAEGFQSDGGKGESGGGGGGESKVVQLTSSNFQKEVLNNPLVSLVACEYIFIHTMR
jgi:protein disulfide-isomerase A6